MKIKYKLFNPNCALEILPQGDWVDLRAAKTVEFKGPIANSLRRVRKGNLDNSFRTVEFDFKLIPLGIAMELPEGYEAVMLPRSSTYKNYRIIMSNSEGVIDNTFNGDNDQWHFPAVAFNDTVINQGDRICQFRIQLSQKATLWQKIKWMLNSKIEFEYVEHLNNDNRGGFGTTGV